MSKDICFVAGYGFKITKEDYVKLKESFDFDEFLYEKKFYVAEVASDVVVFPEKHYINFFNKNGLIDLSSIKSINNINSPEFTDFLTKLSNVSFVLGFYSAVFGE